MGDLFALAAAKRNTREFLILDTDKNGRQANREESVMTDIANDPKELFGLRLAHVGINAANASEAEHVADLFQSLMGLEKSETPKSYFADTLVEVMKENGRGTNGHIGFHVDDIPAAEKWFAARGFDVNEDSRALNPDGTTFLVYFKQEIGGFAIHLTQG